MEFRKCFRKYFMVSALLFVSLVLFNSEAYCWMSTLNFAHGQTGQPAQGISGFDEAGQNTLFSNDMSPLPSAKIYWPAGSESTGDYGLINLPSKLTEGEEMWFKASFYFKSPWLWNTATSGPVKLMRIHIRDSSGNHKGYLSVIWVRSAGVLSLSNEIADLQPELGVTLDKDAWTDVEMYVKFSTTSPVFRIWKNGVLLAEDTTHATLKSTTDKADFVYLMSYWNGGAPQSQTQYITNVTVTTDTPPNRDAKGNPMLSFPPGSPAHTPPSAVTGFGYNVEVPLLLRKKGP